MRIGLREVEAATKDRRREHHRVGCVDRVQAGEAQRCDIQEAGWVEGTTLRPLAPSFTLSRRLLASVLSGGTTVTTAAPLRAAGDGATGDAGAGAAAVAAGVAGAAGSFIAAD